MGKIFISYRRDDTRELAGRMHDALELALSGHLVFIDHDIPAGANWIKHIKKEVGSSDILLAIIGENWLNTLNARFEEQSQKPEQDRKDDYVRLEIATALKKNIKVIPVLIDGVAMPTVHDLRGHEGIEKLHEAQAVAFNQNQFNQGTDNLVKAILNELLLKCSRKYKLALAALASLILIVAVAGIVYFLWPDGNGGEPRVAIQEVNDDEITGTVSPASFCEGGFHIAVYFLTDRWEVQESGDSINIPISENCEWRLPNPDIREELSQIAVHLIPASYPQPSNRPRMACPPLNPLDPEHPEYKSNIHATACHEIVQTNGSD